MRSLILRSAASMLMLMSGTIVFGQTAPKPEPIAGVNETTVVEVGPAGAASKVSAKRPELSGSAPATPIAQTKQEERQKKIWIASMGGLLGGTSADAATSWGKREANPLLRSANGTFGMKALGIKASLAGVSLVPQVLLRKHKEMRKAFIVFNFVQAGVFSGLAFHNIGIPGPK